MIKLKDCVPVIKGKSNMIRSFYMLSLMLLLSGCSVPITCYIFNNTQQSIVITKISVGNKKKEYVLDSNQQVIISEWELQSYSIKYADQLYLYDSQIYDVPDKEYVGYRGTLFWGKRVIKLQIESDAKIYLLKNTEDFPLNNLLEQPPGFPIDLKLMQR